MNLSEKVAPVHTVFTGLRPSVLIRAQRSTQWQETDSREKLKKKKVKLRHPALDGLGLHRDLDRTFSSLKCCLNLNSWQEDCFVCQGIRRTGSFQSGFCCFQTQVLFKCDFTIKSPNPPVETETWTKEQPGGCRTAVRKNRFATWSSRLQRPHADHRQLLW